MMASGIHTTLGNNTTKYILAFCSLILIQASTSLTNFPIILRDTMSIGIQCPTQSICIKLQSVMETEPVVGNVYKHIRMAQGVG